MGHDLKDVAEMFLFGLDENDKIESAQIIPEASTPTKIVIGVETDTGQEFFAEIIPA